MLVLLRHNRQESSSMFAKAQANSELRVCKCSIPRMQYFTGVAPKMASETVPGCTLVKQSCVQSKALDCWVQQS